ncbi:MAG: hypothetical protein WA651_03565, partial [Candidatus Sulfotelmatobacter sp.]
MDFQQPDMRQQESRQLAGKRGQVAEPELTVWQLVDIAWMYTFQNYFRLKKIEDERTRKKEAAEA